MSFVPSTRPRRASTARHLGDVVPMMIGYGVFAVAFCFTGAIVLGLVP